MRRRGVSAGNLQRGEGRRGGGGGGGGGGKVRDPLG